MQGTNVRRAAGLACLVVALLLGCAAGDMGIAALFRVKEGGESK